MSNELGGREWGKSRWREAAKVLESIEKHNQAESHKVTSSTVSCWRNVKSESILWALNRAWIHPAANLLLKTDYRRKLACFISELFLAGITSNLRLQEEGLFLGQIFSQSTLRHLDPPRFCCVFPPTEADPRRFLGLWDGSGVDGKLHPSVLLSLNQSERCYERCSVPLQVVEATLRHVSMATVAEQSHNGLYRSKPANEREAAGTCCYQCQPVWGYPIKPTNIILWWS